MSTLSFRIRNRKRLFLLCLSFLIIGVSFAQLVPGFKANGRILTQGDTVTICVGSKIVYESTAQGNSSINWRFNNGLPATGNSNYQSITYGAAGIDSAWQVVGNGTDKDSMFVIVRVNSVTPIADFSFTPNNECGDVAVNFTNLSTGNGLAYSWKFGDGDSSAVKDPAHQFLNAIGTTGTQSYNVALTVTNDQLCTASATKTVTVKKIPDASLDIGRPEISLLVFNGENTFKHCANIPFYEFRFTNKSTTTAIISQYTIQWGDGSPDSAFTTWAVPIIKHTFPRGKSIMKIIAKGTNGCNGIKIYNVFLGNIPAGSLGNTGGSSICAPNQLSWPINDYLDNAPGTTYKFFVNDGTAAETYQHSPPLSVKHVFNTGSCGYTTQSTLGSYSNAFGASLFVENPCGSSTSSVTPIYVSGKPRAAISLSPSSNICANSTIVINNTSAYGGQVNSTGGLGSTCNNTLKQVWTISPATGYTLTSGSLGSVNGAPNDRFLWTSGSSALYAKFTVPGTYTIKLYVANDPCGIDSIVKTVCVRPVPTASFTMDKREGCVPDIVKLTNTSPAGGCLGESYSWSVSYADPAGCGGTSSYTFINGTSASSKDPQLQFNNSGNYTIRLTVTALASGCTSVQAQDVFVAKGKPKITLPTPATVCLGNDVSPTATVNNCYFTDAPAYLWTFTSGVPATSTSAIPGPVTFNAVGSHTLKLEVTNACGTVSATTNVTVSGPPIANAGADKATCSGTSVQIGTPSSGYTYQWTPATGLSSASVAVPTLTFNYNGPNADTILRYILSVSAGSNCATSDTVFITVKQKPLVTVSPQAAAICSGNSTTLTAAGADSYIWSPATGLSSTSGAIVAASPLSTTTYTVAGTTNGCAATAQATVTVTTVATAVAGRDTTVCNTATTVQLSGTPAGGVWSGGSFVSASGSFNAALAGNGSYKLYYTMGAGLCSKKDSLVITVIDPPTAFAGNDTTLCQSTGSIQLTGTPSGGVWSGSPMVTAAGLFNTGTTGVYNLTYSVGSGTCTSRDVIQLTVANDVANNIITANQAVCSGEVPAPLSGQPISGAAYQWQQSTDGSNWTNIAGATSASYQPVALSASTYFRRLATTALCAGGRFSAAVKITINPDAKADFTLKRTKACAPVSLDTIVILTPYNDRVKEYRWYINDVYAGSGTTFPRKLLTAAGEVIIIKLVAVSSFGCRNDSIQVGFATTSVPSPAFTQSTADGCGPLTVTFTNTTPDAAKYQYHWDFGNGQTADVMQPPAISFAPHPLNTDTTYKITFTTLTGCDNIIQTKYVTVRSKPKALFTPDVSVSCSGGVISFTNTSRGIGNTYTWNFGDGSLPLTTNNTIVTHSFHTGITDTFKVKLVTVNNCGADSLTYDIVVNPANMKIDFAINGKDRFGCIPDSVRFINNSQGANIYKWTFGDGTTLTTFKGVDTVMHIFTKAGTFTVSLTGSNTCSGDSTDTEIVTVQPRPSVAFSAAPLTACLGDTIILTNTSETNINHYWRFGDGTISNVAQPVKTYVAAGSYRIWLTGSKIYAAGNSCSDSAYKDVIIRDTLPGVFTETADGLCAPSTFTFKNRTGGTASTVWSFGDGGTATGDTITHTYALPGRYVVKMVSKSNTSCNYTAGKAIVVEGVSGTLSYNKGTICPKDSVRFEVKSANSAQYRFVFGDGDSVTTTAAIVYHQYKKPGRYVPYVWLTAGSCSLKVSTGDTVNAEQIRVGFKPAMQYTCGATTATFSDTSNAFFGIRSWQWAFGDGTVSSQQNPVKLFTQSGTYTIKLFVTSNSGCTDTANLPLLVTVHTQPVSTITNKQPVCTGQAVAFTAQVQSQDAVAGNSWNFGNNVTATGISATTTYNTAGNYTVRLISRTDFGCADTAFKTIMVNTSPQVRASADVHICRGDSVQLSATGAFNWQWAPQGGLSCYTCSNPWAKPIATTAYTVTTTNNVCTATDTVLVEVVQPVRVVLSVSPKDTICTGQTVQLSASGAYAYTWLPAGLQPNITVPNPTDKPTSTTRYRVVGTDQHNCFSDTAYKTVVVGPYPSVDLGTGRLVAAGSRIQLTPVITNGPIAQYTWTPATNLSCTACSSPVATINNNTLYRLDVKNIYGCAASDTISYSVFCDPDQVYIPNAFSPDGDGINDIFMIRGTGIASISSFKIFNRWGELVFEKANINPNTPAQGWDGKVNGKAIADVYFYAAEVLCTGGSIFTRKGNVTLMLMR